MESRFNGWSHQVLDMHDTAAVVGHVDRYGFAILSGAWQFDAPDFRRLAALYHLGEMYQSGFNRLEHGEGVAVSGMNQIGGLANGNHYAFNGTSDVALHTDGSYLPIGSIKTSILLCKEHALSGGESILFDSVSAFQRLQSERPMLAGILLADNIFRRRSTGTRSGKQYEYIGPVYRCDADGEMVGGFTLDVTADWEYARRVDVRVLDAVAYLARLASSGSPYFLKFALLKGQALIMRNDKLSHGRCTYIDDPAQPRTLLRGLFARKPSDGAICEIGVYEDRERAVAPVASVAPRQHP